MTTMFARTAPTLLTIGTIAVTALLPVGAEAADMIGWQAPQRSEAVRHHRPRPVIRTSYVRRHVQECEFLRIDYIEGRRDIVRVCHPPVF